MEKPKRAAAGSRKRVIHFILAFLFAVGWLGPLAWVGFSDRGVPGVGTYLNFSWRIACLFPGRSKTWDNYYYEVKLADEDEWREVPLETLGDMIPFGSGNRIHRIMAQGGGDRNRVAVLRSVALYIKETFEANHSELPTVVEVRFVRQRFPVGHPDIARSGKPWVIPALAEVPEDQRMVWRQYQFPTGPNRRGSARSREGENK